MKRTVFFCVVCSILLNFFSCQLYDHSVEGYDMVGFCRGISSDIWSLYTDIQYVDFENQNIVYSNKYEYYKLKDSVWNVYSRDETYSSDGVIDINKSEVHLNRDSTKTLIVDDYKIENDYEIHIFSKGDGIIHYNGLIRVEISNSGIKLGWGEIDLSYSLNGISTGAY